MMSTVDSGRWNAYADGTLPEADWDDIEHAILDHAEGLLPADDAAQIEAWLADHPELAAMAEAAVDHALLRAAAEAPSMAVVVARPLARLRGLWVHAREALAPMTTFWSWEVDTGFRMVVPAAAGAIACLIGLRLATPGGFVDGIPSADHPVMAVNQTGNLTLRSSGEATGLVADGTAFMVTIEDPPRFGRYEVRIDGQPVPVQSTRFDDRVRLYGVFGADLAMLEPGAHQVQITLVQWPFHMSVPLDRDLLDVEEIGHK